MRHTFHRLENNRWYLHLPDYHDQDQLEMVDGADILCEILAQGGDRVEVALYPREAEEDEITLLKAFPLNGGYIYTANFNRVPLSTFNIWLCAVTEEVFGEYPDAIGVNRIG